MGERHLDRLFSEAYDGALRGGDRQRFEGHLAGCEQCSRAFDEFRTALDAVHDLHVARMPVPVILPASPPAVEPGRRGRWRGLRAAAMGPRPLGAATVLAAAGVLAVVIAGHVHLGGNSSSSDASRLSLGTSAGGGASSSAFAAPGAASVSGPNASLCGAGVPFSLSPSAGATPPPGFDLSASTSAAAGTLVVAVRNTSYHAGDRVLVYARMSSAGAAAAGAPTAGAGGSAVSTVIVPCVALEGARTATSQQAGAAAAPAPKEAPLAQASPTVAGNANAAPLLELTIPPDTPRGTTLRIVALVPPGTTGVGAPVPAEAVLTISVT